MSYCFVLASSYNRVDALRKCVSCIEKSKYKDDDFYLFYQGKHDGVDLSFFKDVVYDDNLRGVFTPRYTLMKQYGVLYDYVIVIDDDLFFYPNTDYSTAMSFLEFNKRAGCCTILTHRGKRYTKGLIKNVSSEMGVYNVEGGIVYPRRSIQAILDYFEDKEKDYTEDVFWLLLYVKGYDLYRDYSSSSIHTLNYKNKGKYTGFSKMRMEKPHVPMLEEWYDTKVEYEERFNTQMYQIKQLKDINENGKRERKKNLEARYGKT